MRALFFWLGLTLAACDRNVAGPASHDGSPNTKAPATSLKSLVQWPSVKGSLTPASIKQILINHKDEVQQCYKGEPNKNRPPHGHVSARWRTTSDGGVSEPAIDTSTVNDSATETCVLNHLKSWRFPQHHDPAPVEVSYPFVFKAW